MKKMNEIIFGNDLIVLRDNLVTSSILPKKADQLGQRLKVEANVIIEGAVYSDTIEVTAGPSLFKGATYANKELHVFGDLAEPVKFEKAVASASTVAAMPSKGLCIFGSDINATAVRIKNCFVAGSIYAADVYIENSVVLGGVFSSKTLEIDSSIVGTFNAPEVRSRGCNYLLYPTAFSVQPMSFIPGTVFYNLSIADLGALFKGEPQKPNTGKIEVDIFNDSQKTSLVDNEGAQTVVHSYSVANRVLLSDMVDFNSFENHFIILSASLGSQILRQYNIPLSNGEAGPELSIDNIAEFFMKILNGTIEVQDINGETTFDELRKRYGN